MKSSRYLITILLVLLLLMGAVTYWSRANDEEFMTSSYEPISLAADGFSVEEPTEGAFEDARALRPRDLTRQASTGAIDLSVQFVNPIDDHDEIWLFQIEMDTHSVDLDQIDLNESVFFTDENGRVIEDGFRVIKSGSGHHVVHIVELPKKIDGVSTIGKDSKTFQMVFRDLDGVERIELFWNMTMYPEIF